MKSLSSVQTTIRNTNDYVNVNFDTLLQRQQQSCRKASLGQLGVDGVGYVCLRNPIVFHEEIRKNLEISLRKSDAKVFRTEHTDSMDLTRKQVVTTYGNALKELQTVNKKKKHGIPAITDTEMRNTATFLHHLQDFICQQDFFKQSRGALKINDTILSVLGSFSPSFDQTLHWDYSPEVVRKLPAKKQPYFVFGALEDNTYVWIVPNSHRAAFNPKEHKLNQTMLVKMMKGDVLVCNALILHAGYGYGFVNNIRYHMYIWNRDLHLKALYDVDESSPEAMEESTKPGNELSLRFLETAYKGKCNKIGVTTQRRHDEFDVKNMLTTKSNKRKVQSIMNLIPKKKSH